MFPCRASFLVASRASHPVRVSLCGIVCWDRGARYRHAKYYSYCCFVTSRPGTTAFKALCLAENIPSYSFFTRSSLVDDSRPVFITVATGTVNWFSFPLCNGSRNPPVLCYLVLKHHLPQD
jgi:hypothetical protein